MEAFDPEEMKAGSKKVSARGGIKKKGKKKKGHGKRVAKK